ncbi:Gfo/Idh/MocA family oxidoreductase [Undibacterium arcticum]
MAAFLTNQASHHVDLLEWMMGDVDSVHARSMVALAHIEAEDTAIATLKFRNGALGIIEATTAARPADLEGSISVLGERGAVEIAGFFSQQDSHLAVFPSRPSRMKKSFIDILSIPRTFMGLAIRPTMSTSLAASGTAAPQLWMAW